MAMSVPVLYKKLKAVTNLSVNEFIKSMRLKKASELLKKNQYTINEITYAIGYSDRKYFSREFKRKYGQTPSDYASSFKQDPDNQ
ncbi:helix-turn-helix transcriptional regulator [Flavihumibacter sp. CACIAM 22H1]|uniref:helix-turn-helix domain-containing protein n=1 Tax=Flavihumibacter sp. CACIAM 22H1 TaxID=1812911 RepID=UPI0007A818EC|nr:helix-turn-helix transcriptional regulator [Flavihumibacter sp. CACIAM 22H1]KYP16003.1 MAG: hypothetical protein A1D16_07020 [Flavihumibacter sp. CACIAM 22H1]